MRPLAGETEHESQQVVDMMCQSRISLCHLHCISGWVTAPSDSSGVGNEDFSILSAIDQTAGFLDDMRLELTPVGNAKVANALAGYLCAHLNRSESCSLLRHDRYVGEVSLPDEDQLGRTLESSKRKKLDQMLLAMSG